MQREYSPIKRSICFRSSALGLSRDNGPPLGFDVMLNALRCAPSRVSRYESNPGEALKFNFRKTLRRPVSLIPVHRRSGNWFAIDSPRDIIRDYYSGAQGKHGSLSTYIGKIILTCPTILVVPGPAARSNPRLY